MASSRSGTRRWATTTAEGTRKRRSRFVDWHNRELVVCVNGTLTCELAASQYSLLNPRWVLPSKAYHLSKAVPGSPQIEIYVLDTCPLVCGDLNKVRHSHLEASSFIGHGIDRLSSLVCDTDQLERLYQPAQVQGMRGVDCMYQSPCQPLPAPASTCQHLPAAD